ncbi:N-formylglutamate amidohydrolase [Streptomyces sp. NPDC050388]|uniref:N-formylglutamate amidohydrolase n=1 Tax=Streptomyces sp. NPDC050388 TaxID=3155781 RepID=UPI003425C4ED
MERHRQRHLEAPDGHGQVRAGDPVQLNRREPAAGIGIRPMPAARVSSGTPWRFVDRLSRPVVDPGRFPGEREEMPAVGVGAVYTGTSHRGELRPDGHDGRPLVERYFHPYAEAMTDAVAERPDAVGRAVVIDARSYPTEPLPYELHGTGPARPSASGHEPLPHPGRAARPRGEGVRGFRRHGDRQPLRGTYAPLEYSGKDPRVSALVIEVRRDLYTDEPGGPAGPGPGAPAEAPAEPVRSAHAE